MPIDLDSGRGVVVERDSDKGEIELEQDKEALIVGSNAQAALEGGGVSQRGTVAPETSVDEHGTGLNESKVVGEVGDGAPQTSDGTPDDFASTGNVITPGMLHVSAQQLEQNQADLKDDANFVGALSELGVNPTAGGLAAIEAAATKNPNAYATVVQKAKIVSATGGASETANQDLANASADFLKTTGLPATAAGDLAYMMARIMIESDARDRDDTLKVLEAAKTAAEFELAAADNSSTWDKEYGAIQHSDGGKKSGGDTMLAAPSASNNAAINAQNNLDATKELNAAVARADEAKMNDNNAVTSAMIESVAAKVDVVAKMAANTSTGSSSGGGATGDASGSTGTGEAGTTDTSSPGGAQ